MGRIVKIKQTATLNCEVDIVNNTYTIRLRDYVGATFTVDLGGKVNIGLSQRMSFDWNSWLLLQSEITEARKYLAKVKMTGKHPIAKDVEKTIKPSQYEDNGIYLDIKGRVILYLGEGLYIDSDGRDSNRSGCYVCYAILKEVPKNYIVSGNSVILNIPCVFDSYRGKPTNLVKKMMQLPSNVNSFYQSSDVFFCNFKKFDAGSLKIARKYGL